MQRSRFTIEWGQVWSGVSLHTRRNTLHRIKISNERQRLQLKKLKLPPTTALTRDWTHRHLPERTKTLLFKIVAASEVQQFPSHSHRRQQREKLPTYDAHYDALSQRKDQTFVLTLLRLMRWAFHRFPSVWIISSDPWEQQWVMTASARVQSDFKLDGWLSHARFFLPANQRKMILTMECDVYRFLFVCPT